MRHRRSSSTPTLASIALAVFVLGTLGGAWAGCASGEATTNTTSTHNEGGNGGGNGTGTTSGTSTGTAGSGGTGGGSACAGDEKSCNSVCVKVTDPAYGCTQTGCDACPTLANGASACAVGVCVLGDCADGFKNCDGNDANGCEVNVTNDPKQCGGCGSACSVPNATPNCVNSKCGVGTCDDGRVDCDGDPLNGCEAILAVDPKNCGSCGHPCPGTQTCQNSICGLYCPKDKANCDGDETNGCETPLHTVGDCAFCGDACAPANASAHCDQNGVCNLDECNQGWSNCDTSSANGCETNTAGDANNCNSCGNVCPSGPHATAICQSGACKINCDPGYSDCDGDPNNGCEVHSDVDVNNCGGCGNKSAAFICNTPHATPACAGGKCIVGQCDAGYENCDTNPANGCEINIQNNPQNCGGCGLGCTVANGTPACVNAMCAVGSCNMGWANCNNNVSDGCETNTAADTANCGTCNNVCNLPNAAQACTGGICTIGACNAGWANCNNQHGDGCEVNTTNNPQNCGGCNMQCFVANGTAGCGNSMCTVASCNNGWGNCNGFPQDGCETNLTNTLANCGACGNNCQASCSGDVLATTCSAGSCSITACTPGHFNIDGTCSNGCECTSSGHSSVCAAPTSLGALSVGQTKTHTGNLVPGGQEAYLAITFNNNTNYGYHPRVRMTAGTTEFAFDILTNCQGTALSCGVEGGNSGGKTDWEVFYSAGDPNDPGTFNAIPAVGNGGTVIIHVYRKAGQALSCNNYTLVISN